MEDFGQVIETCLIKYGRGIVDEQFILNRITQAAFDTYTMAVVLSRVTMSLNKNLPSAEHELLMAQTWCAEVNIFIFFINILAESICICCNHFVYKSNFPKSNE